MAKDLILGKSKRNWARGVFPTELAPIPTSDEVTLKLTPPEMTMLAELAAIKIRADSGDKAARQKMGKAARRVAELKKKASRGDASAKRSLQVLRESGVFGPTLAMTMGSEVQVPNVAYRAAVLRQASRLAGGRRPSTKDFFRAKSAVDKIMGSRGITLYLPGSRPGRMTA